MNRQYKSASFLEALFFVVSDPKNLLQMIFFVSLQFN